MTTRALTLAVLVTLAITACKQPTPPSAPTAPTAGSNQTSGEPETFIGRKAKDAIDKARQDLLAGNISLNGQYAFKQGVFTPDRDSKDMRPEAAITPQGDLLIDGKKIDVTPEQHALLVTYRGQIVQVAEAGMAMGIRGADMAGKALNGVTGAIFGGKDGEKDFEARMKAQGEAMEAEARKLCTQLQPMLATQQQLATSLPAFKPYATMTQADVDDCMKKDGDKSAAMGDAVRNEVRDTVRAEVRNAVQQATGNR